MLYRYCITSLLTILLFSFQCKTQKEAIEENTKPSKAVENVYELGLQFSSVCCGPADNKLFKSAINTYITEKNLNLNSIEKYAPLGKEGEYFIGFQLDNWTSQQITELAEELKRIDYKKDTSTGYVSIQTYFSTKDFDNHPLAKKTSLSSLREW